MRHNARRVVRSVGRRLAELRAQRGRTQEAVAEELGVSPQWLSRVESGENLSIETLTRFANYYDVEIAALFDPPASTERPGRGRPKKDSKPAL